MSNRSATRVLRGLGIAAVCLLTACQPQAIAPTARAEGLGASAGATHPVVDEGSGAITWENGMSYASLRRQLLSDGWVPLADAQCRANVAGDNHLALCTADAKHCQPCDDLPELSACSGTGHCVLQFQRAPGQVLRVSTYGDVHRIAPDGEREDLMVTAVMQAVP